MLLKQFGLYIEKRTNVSRFIEILSAVGAILLSLLLSSILILAAKADILEVYKALYNGAFGSVRSFLETLVQATPIIFTGLAVLIAFQAKIWNIGGEGQFFAGAMAAAWLCMSFPNIPKPIFIPILILTSSLGGAFWSFIPGFLKAKFNTNEIIVTVMMNYIILLVLSYLLTSTWTDPGDYYLQTPRFGKNSYLPTFFDSRIHLGLFIAFGLVILIYIFLWRSPLGYEIRAIGINRLVAKYRGIKIQQVTILVMIISGAIAGLAGGTEVTGLHHRLRLEISTGYGFIGILVAMLGRLNPFGVLLAGFLFGALINGSTSMQIITGVPVALVYSFQGIVLIFLLMADIFSKYRLRRIIQNG